MREFELNLVISAEKMLSYYQGSAQQVLAKDIQGVSLAFPAQALRPFVTKDGIHGRFRLRVDDNNKLIELQKIS